MEKVAIIGTAGVPARYGGFETLAHQLVNQLNESFELHVYCSSKFYKKNERVSYWNKARLHYLPLNANGVQSILYDIISIIHALFYADALIVLGVSGGIMIPFIKLFTKKKIVVNIDGLEWKREKWNYLVRKYLKLSERLAVKFSDADVTDNEAIKAYTATEYKTLSYLIEYGADHVSSVTPNSDDYQRYPFLRKDYAFKVCRIEPENNVHVVLEAFSQMQAHTLVMVGNWNASAYGQQLRVTYGKHANLILLDPIYHQRSIDLLRSQCKMYIHGHSAGGTNPSLVGAMYLGRAILAYDVSYNKATTEHKALYFKNVAELIGLVENATQLQLYRNAAAMKDVANRRYTWEEIASKYAQLIYGFGYEYIKKPIRSQLSGLDALSLQDEGLAHLKNTKLFYE